MWTAPASAPAFENNLAFDRQLTVAVVQAAVSNSEQGGGQNGGGDDNAAQETAVDNADADPNETTAASSASSTDCDEGAVDLSDQCSLFASVGHCNIGSAYYSFMVTWCKKTCQSGTNCGDESGDSSASGGDGGEVAAPANNTYAEPEEFESASGSGFANNTVGAGGTKDGSLSEKSCSELGWDNEMRSSGRKGDTKDICVQAKLNEVCHSQNNRDWTWANLLCSNEGGRLCTDTEMAAGVLKGAGCNLGSRYSNSTRITTPLCHTTLTNQSVKYMLEDIGGGQRMRKSVHRKKEHSIRFCFCFEIW